MKKIFGLALATVALATSCKDKFEQPKNYSSFAVIHASPDLPSPNSDTLHVFVEDQRYTSSAGVVYLASSSYLPVLSGSHTINIRRKGDAASALYVAPFTSDFAPGGIYSYFVYDTTTSATAQAKVLKLRDTLTLPPNTNSKVRFLHLAPNGPAVDVTLLRTSVTPNDSVTLSNRTYVGATPNETTLAGFTQVPRGNYTAKIKLAGTQTVVATVAANMTNGTNVTEGGIFTIYASGTAKGRPLAGRLIRHY